MKLIQKAYDFEVKQVGEPKNRTLEFVGSTAHVDRYGDVIEVQGWDLKNYKKNPVFLWAHNYSMPPVGKAVKVAKTDNALTFQIQFAPPETYPFAETIYQLYLGGFLRATSVGFAGLEREPILDKEGRQTGVKFLKQDLYELSAVPVPANPNALMLAMQKGIVSGEEIKALQESNLLPDEGVTASEKDSPESANNNPNPVKARQDEITQLRARIEALEKRAQPEWIKTFVETQNMLQQVLLSVLSQKAAGDGNDLYGQLLNPGNEPKGEQPKVDLSGMVEFTKRINNLLSK